MSWTQLTVDDVLKGLAPQEVASLQAIGGDKGDSFIELAVNEARGAIGAGRYSLGPDGTTPDQLDRYILAVARWEWLASFPQLQKLQTRERQALAQEARDVFQAIREAKYDIEPPTGWANNRAGQAWSDHYIPGRMTRL
jgi:hypothetical protein